MSATQTLPLYQSNESADWALIENIDQRQLAETHLAPGEPASACKLSRGSSSLGTGNGALSVAAGSVVVGGETFDIAEQSVDIPYGDDEPRRDVVYVDGDGDVQVRLGQPGPLVWSDGLTATSQTLTNAYRPAPPDLASTSGFVLGVVTVEANAASLAAEDVLHDLRIGPPVATPREHEHPQGQVVVPADASEAELRSAVEGASPGQRVVLERRDTPWGLTSTLTVPTGVVLIGSGTIQTNHQTLMKQFDGPLVNIENFVTIRNVTFHGNRNDYGGNVAEVSKSRDLHIWNCQFIGGAGNGWHQDDGFFNTFYGCRFQQNDGWGIWLGESENPHNQWLGPCYIGKNGEGGVYQASYGRNQQMFAWIGDNAGPAIQFDEPGSNGGFVGFEFRGSLIGNAGPGYLVTGGNQRNHRIVSTQIAENASSPDSGLTGPVGHIQVEGGSAGLTIVGGQAYGHGQLIQATDTNSTVVVESPSDALNGDVDGSNLAVELRGSATVNGSISAERSGPLSRIYLDSAQSIPNEEFTPLALDADTDDALGGVDTANGQITLPTDGTYSILANVRALGVPSGSRIIARIDVDGTELARADSHAAVSGGSALTARVSDQRRLDGGRNVTALAWQDSGGSLDLRNVESETFLAVTKTE